MGLVQWVPIGMNIEIVKYKDLDNGLDALLQDSICVYMSTCIWSLCLYVYLYLKCICFNIVLARTKTVQ